MQAGPGGIRLTGADVGAVVGAGDVGVAVGVVLDCAGLEGRGAEVEPLQAAGSRTAATAAAATPAAGRVTVRRAVCFMAVSFRADPTTVLRRR
ncbi:MAG TPA: hypothetical protein VEK80_18780 [Kribbellaceae bacterium]|nr:hypothetical protein [Kribbellaceae bacterium]